jgi:hypothetical protein
MAAKEEQFVFWRESPVLSGIEQTFGDIPILWLQRKFEKRLGFLCWGLTIKEGRFF